MCSNGAGFWSTSSISPTEGFAQDIAVRAVQPVISSLSPSGGTQFDDATTLYINGLNFLANAPVVALNGANQTTTIVSDTQCTIALAASGLSGTVLDVPASNTVAVTTSQGTTTNSTWVVSRFAAEELWFRADLGITLATTKVSAMADQSGIGDANRGLSQGTDANRPLYNTTDAAFNSQATITFTGTVTHLPGVGTWAAGVAQPITVYFVGTIPAPSITRYAFSMDNTPTYALQAINSTNLWRSFRGNSLSGTALCTAKSAVCCIFNANLSSLRVNNITTTEATGTQAAATMNAMTVGSRSGTTATFASGTFAEMLVFSAAHSAAQRALIMGYLGRRYTITIGA